MQCDKDADIDVDAARLRADWLTIWRCEAAALAADREVAEALATLLDAALRDPAGVPAVPRPDAAPGATPAGDAPPARGPDAAEVALLRARLDELERRLASLGDAPR